MEIAHNDVQAMDYGGFFDHIDDFLDVPNYNAGEFQAQLDSSSIHPIVLGSFPPAPSSDLVFSNSDISVELSVPYEDIVQLEWLSSFVDDSFSGDTSVNGPPSLSPDERLSHRRFRISSPISVLDSSSSCSAEKTVNFRPITVLPSAVAAYSGSENSAESCLLIKTPKGSNTEGKRKTKRKKMKFTLPGAKGDDHGPSQQPVRKCLHCEITETPQWREGPMGPKTLCNACGVRYKTGQPPAQAAS